MYNINCESSSGIHYTYSLRISVVDVNEIDQYQNCTKFNELCRLGCKNYNRKWSCPPLSPDFKTYSTGYKFLLIFIMSMNMNQFGHIKNDYTKIKAANTMLKSRIDKLLRTKMSEGKMISTGSCRLCKKCRLTSNEPCNHPELMSYSYEALGIDVDKMTFTLCNHQLLWYSKGNLPEYTSVVAGLLANDNINIDDYVRALQEIR